MMKKTGVLFLAMLIVLAVPIAQAGPPDVSIISKKSMDALDAGRQGSTKVAITVKEGNQVTSEWGARMAHKEFQDGRRALLVILEPESLKGNAYLFWKPENKPLMEWVYFPSTRRVRSLTTLMSYNSFLGTDFTWADLGIRDPGGTDKFLSEEVHAGQKSYKIETVPHQKWYYSRIVSWISADTFLPIQRDYFDINGMLWKTKLFENVVVLNNRPMPLKIRMLDVKSNRSTEVIISDVCLDVEYIPKEAFDPEKLSEASLSPVCSVPIPKKN